MGIPEMIRRIGIKPLDLDTFVKEFKPLMRADWDIEAGTFPFRLVDRPVLRRKGHLWNVNLRDDLVIICPREESSEPGPRDGYPFGGCIVRPKSAEGCSHEASRNPKVSDIKNLIWTQVPHQGEFYQVRIPVYVPTRFMIKKTEKPWGSIWLWHLNPNHSIAQETI